MGLMSFVQGRGCRDFKVIPSATTMVPASTFAVFDSKSSVLVKESIDFNLQVLNSLMHLFSLLLI